MGEKRLWLYMGIFFFLIDVVLAGEVSYVTQNQQNSFFAFSGSPSYKDVQQTFIAPEDFTITAVALNLKALNPQGCGIKLLRVEVLDQYGNYVTDSGWLGDFENVAGSMYYYFLGYGYLSNYFDFVRIPLFDTTKDSLISGKQYQLRVYTNVCSSSSETNSAFALAGSTSDVYSDGQASAKPASFQIKDFSFKILGYTPQPTCKEDITCENNQIVQIYSDCSKQYLQTCSGDFVCETGSCIYKYPLMNLFVFNIYKNDNYNQPETSFIENDKATVYASPQNTNGKSGTYTTTITIYDSNNNIVPISNNPYTETRSISGLAGDTVQWPIIIDSKFKEGSYKVVAAVQNCQAPNTCTLEKTFSVGPTCYDKDGDSVTTCQGDCNDNDPSASSYKSCSYNGKSCGSYQLCVDQCPTLPVEVCDGSDNNCNSLTDENNVCSATTYYCDKDGDGVISSSVSGTCTTFDCVPPSCTLNQGTDCDDTSNMIKPSALEICDQKDNNCNNQIDETFDFSVDNNNCGGCGIVCTTDQVCDNNICLSLDGLIVSQELFNTVLLEADEKNIVINQNMKDVAQNMQGVVQAYKDANKVKEAVLLTGNTLYEFLQLLESVKNDLLGYTYITKFSNVEWEGKMYSIKSITIGSSLDAVDDILIKTKVPQILNAIKNLPPELGITTSMIIGFAEGNGDTTGDYVFNSIIYGSGNFIMFYPAVLSFIGDGVLTLVGPDTPITDIVNWLKEMQYYYKQEAPASTCGSTINGAISCWSTMINSLTHPLVFINNINIDQNTAFVNVKNYWGNTIGGEIYLGITTMNSDTKCNHQPKKIYLAPNESKEIVFENLNISSNKEYVITAYTWYSCNSPTESICVSDLFCEKPLYSYSITYTPPNPPQIISPQLNEVTNTQNPTFIWNGIVGEQPIQYTINIFKDADTNLLFTKTIADPNPSSLQKEYTLNDITLEKDKNYFVQIVAINNNGVELSSEKVKFYVDCYTNDQCGEISTSFYCGLDGNSYQETKTPLCQNPGTLQSQCVVETTSGKANSCSYGCENGNCNTLISAPDMTEDAELSYVGTANILDWRVNDVSLTSLNLPFEAHAESGTKTKDYSINQNNGVITGAVFKQNIGYNGKGAYYFAGNNNAGITVTQPINISKYTVSLWIKPESVTGYKNFLYMPESKRYFSISNGICSWTGTFWSCTKKAPVVNTWTHIIITSDGNVYQNGVYDGSIRTLPLTGVVTLGDRDQTAYDFKGYLDHVKVYNRVLSPQQIQKLANKQQHIIVAEETLPTETWNVAVTSNNGIEDTETTVSNSITLKHGINSFTPLLVSSDGDVVNDTSNLFLTQLVDPPLKNIIDWRVGGTSISVLNMPFESHTESGTKAKDYSTNKNDAIITTAVFKQTAGHDGKGAYYFAGNNNAGISSSQQINLTAYTVSMWIKPEVVYGYRNFMYVPESKRYFSVNKGICSWSGTLWECTKKIPPLNTWTHIAITSEGKVYQNGLYDGIIKTLLLTGTVILGDRDQTAYDFRGYLDDVKVYNRVLSPQQIAQLSTGKQDVLAHQETLSQQSWNAAVTANNGITDGATKVTNTLKIT